MKALSGHSGVPYPFECFCCCEVEDSKFVEKNLQHGLGDFKERKEFYKITPARVKSLLELASIGDATPGQDISDLSDGKDPSGTPNIPEAEQPKRKPPRSSFKFSMVGIKLETKLALKGHDTKIATVISDNRIMFEGKTYSLSGAAEKLLRRKKLRGTSYWCVQGESETLSEKRDNVEKGSLSGSRKVPSKSKSQEERKVRNTKQPTKRPQFTFKMVRIRPGAVLIFSRDPRKTVKVVGDRDVEYRGGRHTLNKVTLTLLAEMGTNWSSVRGPNFWIYKGETLTDRRIRMEKEGSIDQ